MMSFYIINNFTCDFFCLKCFNIKSGVISFVIQLYKYSYFNPFCKNFFLPSFTPLIFYISKMNNAEKIIATMILKLQRIIAFFLDEKISSVLKNLSTIEKMQLNINRKTKKNKIIFKIVTFLIYVFVFIMGLLI